MNKKVGSHALISAIPLERSQVHTRSNARRRSSRQNSRTFPSSLLTRSSVNYFGSHDFSLSEFLKLKLTLSSRKSRRLCSRFITHLKITGSAKITPDNVHAFQSKLNQLWNIKVLEAPELQVLGVDLYIPDTIERLEIGTVVHTPFCARFDFEFISSNLIFSSKSLCSELKIHYLSSGETLELPDSLTTLCLGRVFNADVLFSPKSMCWHIIVEGQVSGLCSILVPPSVTTIRTGDFCGRLVFYEDSQGQLLSHCTYLELKNLDPESSFILPDSVEYFKAHNISTELVFSPQSRCTHILAHDVEVPFTLPPKLSSLDILSDEINQEEEKTPL